MDDPVVMKMRERANAAAERLASLRDRLIALRPSCGGDDGLMPPAAFAAYRTVSFKFDPNRISNPFEVKAPIDANPAAANAVGGETSRGGSTSLPKGITLQKSPKTMLDYPVAIPPSGVKHMDAPPITQGPSGFLEGLARLVGQKGEVAQDDMLRRFNMTETIGNPGKMALCARAQDADDTCAVVSQQVVEKCMVGSLMARRRVTAATC